MEDRGRLDNRHRLCLPMQMGRVGTYLVQQYNCLLLEIQVHHRFHRRRYQDWLVNCQEARQAHPFR